MNKWLAVYAFLIIACVIGFIQLGWDYETIGYGLHPALCAVAILLLSLVYWAVTKVFSDIYKDR